MGFKAGERVLSALRKHAKHAFRNALLNQQDERVEAVSVDVNSLIFSLFNRCETGRDLLVRLQAMVEQHVEAGAKASAFCLDERWLVPESKGVEWRKREASSSDQGNCAYTDTVELAAPLVREQQQRQPQTNVKDSSLDDIEAMAIYDSDEEEQERPAGAARTSVNSVPLEQYEFDLDMPMPSDMARVKKTPLLMRKLMRFISRLLAFYLDLSPAALLRSDISEYTVYVCGFRCTSLGGADNEDKVETVVGNECAMHTSVSCFDLASIRNELETKALAGDDNDDDAEVSWSTDNAAQRQRRLHFTHSTDYERVEIGEAEGKAVHWAVHQFLLRHQMQVVAVHANDSDALAALLMAVPILVADGNGRRVILQLHTSYLLKLEEQPSLEQYQALLDKTDKEWEHKQYKAEIKALKNDPMCRHKTVDVVELWAEIMRANQRLDESIRCKHPVETFMAVMMMAGNDYVDGLPYLGVGALWKALMSQQGARLLRSSISVLQVENARHDIEFSEEKLLEFVYMAARDASKPFCEAMQRKYDETLGSSGKELHAHSLETLFAVANEAIIEKKASGNGKCTWPQLMPYQAMRAWLRRVMWSLDYYGNMSVAPISFVDPFATIGGVPLYGYERDPDDGMALPSAVVLHLRKGPRNMFSGSGRIVVCEDKSDPIAPPSERSLHQIRLELNSERERKRKTPPSDPPARQHSGKNQPPPPKRAKLMQFKRAGQPLPREQVRRQPMNQRKRPDLAPQVINNNGAQLRRQPEPMLQQQRSFPLPVPQHKPQKNGWKKTAWLSARGNTKPW